MQKIEHYRLRAQECRELASRARNESDRQMLLNMAETWETMAVGRAQQLQRNKRLRALDRSEKMNRRRDQA
jgi:hypothetical protein